MAKNKKSLLVQGDEITLLPQKGQEDYISLTDIMKRFDDEFSIYSWMRNSNTVEFLGVWEQLHNPLFKGNEFVTFKNQAGSNNFNLTPKKWIDNTNAIGITVKSGRYGGGTFAHRDIAINFCYWLSPTFQLYLIKEFQRLKEIEAQEHYDNLDWNIKRLLTKINYSVHTDAIKENLIPPRLAQGKPEGLVYANEADILNIALFGKTAKIWRLENPDTKGNIRDHATTEQLLVLVNLEAINAELIRQGINEDERVLILNKAAIKQMHSILDSPSRPNLPPPEINKR
jgi:hypothetical protein